MKQIRLLVVDDQALVRSGFRMILDAEDDLTVVGEAADGNEAVAATCELRPDVVLMDVRMPSCDGVEATRQITASLPADACRVIILTTFDLDDYVFSALRAGASGFLLKDTPPDELLRAIRVVASGDALMAPSVTRRLIEAFAAGPDDVPASTPIDPADDRPTRPTPIPELATLTAREREVLEVMATGLSNAEIAAQLYVSEPTVKTHVGHILAKLGVRDRVQAVVAAYESGLVRPGS